VKRPTLPPALSRVSVVRANGLEIVLKTCTYVCTRIESTSFVLDNRFYPAGSWLVMGSHDTYARAMTDAEFTAWATQVPMAG
jgi:hypothetical protein